MTPERQETVNGHKIAEYYWAGEMVVYIDNRLSPMSFDDAVRNAREPAKESLP